MQADNEQPNEVPAPSPAGLSAPGKTMSSLMIAELTGKQHAHVIRDIEVTLKEAAIDASKFGGIYNDAYGREKPCYWLPRLECDLVISGYSVRYRHALIKRWHELEAKAAPEVEQMFQVPTTMAEALRLAADVLEENAAQKIELIEAAPKVLFHDTVTESNTDCSVAMAAQVAKLPFGQNTLFRKLREMGVLMSGGSRHNCPKQRFIEQGLFNVSEYAYQNSDKQTEIRFTTLVTQKGLAWIIKTFGPKEGQAA